VCVRCLCHAGHLSTPDASASDSESLSGSIPETEDLLREDKRLFELVESTLVAINDGFEEFSDRLDAQDGAIARVRPREV
jgi:hypothetical protein